LVFSVFFPCVKITHLFSVCVRVYVQITLGAVYSRNAARSWEVRVQITYALIFATVECLSRSTRFENFPRAFLSLMLISIPPSSPQCTDKYRLPKIKPAHVQRLNRVQKIVSSLSQMIFNENLYDYKAALCEPYEPQQFPFLFFHSTDRYLLLSDL